VSKIAILGASAATLIVVVGAAGAGLAHRAHHDNRPRQGSSAAATSSVDPSSDGMVDLVTHDLPYPPALTGDVRAEFLAANHLVHSRFPDVATEAWADDQLVIHLGVTDMADRDAVTAALAGAGAEDVVLEPVTYSQKDLDAIVNGGVSNEPGLKDVNSATHDYPNNRVLLTAAKVTSELRKALDARYGDAVALVSVPMTFSN
jgi:hypothetical protein